MLLLSLIDSWLTLTSQIDVGLTTVFYMTLSHTVTPDLADTQTPVPLCRSRGKHISNRFSMLTVDCSSRLNKHWLDKAITVRDSTC